MTGTPGREPKSDGDSVPRHVVALGGGTGLPSVLRGLRRFVEADRARSLTAVVTMSDDGGSSGRLRRSMGVPPPGDVRNCLVALAAEEDLIAGLFQHRFGSSEELRGHSVGNLILAALAEQHGCFVKAVEMSSRVLRTVGRILPSTAEDVRLEAVLEDGTSIIGETAVAAVERPVTRIALFPPDPEPGPGVVDAIAAADLVVLGPGSVFTSLLPILAVPKIAEALRATRACVALVGNLVSERGEGVGLTLADHVLAIDRHAGASILDGILVHDGDIDPAIRERYEAEGAVPLSWTEVADRVRPRVVPRNLIAPGRKLRHDPGATAAGLLDLWHAFRSEREVGEPA